MHNHSIPNLRRNGAISDPEPLALYIHWPFCLSKCPYCDFNSHVAQTIPQEIYAEALAKELRHALANVQNHILVSIFFGGGTPSLMAPQTVQNLIDYATHHLPISDNIEITLEANPTSVETEKLLAFRQAGINRLSLGVQSLNPNALRNLGRQHTVQQAIHALTLAKNLFPTFSFDLIYARENQTLSEWQRELQTALDLASDHLSLYQLTIEPGTLFAKYHQQGKLQLPDDKLGTELYCATEALVQKYDMQGYEISNYARPGMKSRHNLAYWRYQDYIGIGPGAHGRISENTTLYATERYKNPKKWLAAVQEQGHGLSLKEALNSRDKAREMVLMGLRLQEGIKATDFQKRCDMQLTETLNMEKVTILNKEGYLSWNGKRLKTTHEGKLKLNAILETILR